MGRRAFLEAALSGKRCPFGPHILQDIQRMAQSKRMTVAEWVRQTLRAAQRGEAGGDTAGKFATIQAAARHTAPTADMDQMLKEIESGYTGHPQ